MATLICPKCDKNFDSETLSVYRCPDCKKWLEAAWKPSEPPQRHEPRNAAHEKLEDLDSATKALVMATNRTTFAVRSLALFFFISVQTALLGGGIIGLALGNRAHYDDSGELNQGATFFVSLGYLIAFIGFLVAVLVGRWELNKSKVNR